MSEMFPLGKQVRIVRTLRGMSQAELAAAVGVTQQTISDTERGITNPRPETEAAIKEALNWGQDVDSIFARMLDLANVEAQA